MRTTPGPRHLQALPDVPPDEELVLAAQAGDERALERLLDRYRGFVRVRARRYFLSGGEPEDLVQEATIGLFKAVRDYDAGAEASFRTFADLCVTRQVLTAVKAATRLKHLPLNTSLSLSAPVRALDGDDRTVEDLLPGRTAADPADVLVSRERVQALQAHVDETLSDLETEVLRLYLDGSSYVEIAERVQRHPKAVDNALQRVKRKIGDHLRERALAEAG